ncbi:hypothetical protein PR202_ga28884 [Eleusine coracana subsp. coracana]|uniref:F-box domain-containing protein n=1 Tax=Eleusine coracana subsp. coracana TaxID=191504 RepID=A0AAV5DKB3_ELECO|nr:hypothetical protein PR202_ga28884 [Eleusine coracana subsp. coracana]
MPQVHVYLPDDIVTEILVRLPGESVLRARAVSRSWRRITTDPAFIVAHARRRPLELIRRNRVRSARPPDRHPDGDDIAVNTIPVSGHDVAGRPRRLMRYPCSTKRTPGRSPHGLAVVSCDGVLLLKIGHGIYLICNPVTRQWAELPEVHSSSFVLEFGFYRHQPSGEHRLLCRCNNVLRPSIRSHGASACKHRGRGQGRRC